VGGVGRVPYINKGTPGLGEEGGSRPLTFFISTKKGQKYLTQAWLVNLRKNHEIMRYLIQGFMVGQKIFSV